MKKQTATLAIATIGTFAALETGATQSVNSVEELPNSGMVTLKGTVEDVNINNDFTLRDQHGRSIEIDVVTNQPLDIEKGDRVKVTGDITTGALGIEEEIDATNIQIMSDAHSRSEYQYSDRSLNRGEAMDNKAALTEDDDEWHGGEYGRIDQLPMQGKVQISGVVTDFEPEENRFELRDQTGETIDIHTAKNIDVNEGQRVRVQGMKTDEPLGVGEQIVSAQVQILN